MASSIHVGTNGDDLYEFQKHLAMKEREIGARERVSHSRFTPVVHVDVTSTALIISWTNREKERRKVGKSDGDEKQSAQNRPESVTGEFYLRDRF